VWVSVKEANPGLSVCEIGSIIGRLWRELSDAEKKSYSLDFEQEKVSLYYLYSMFKILLFVMDDQDPVSLFPAVLFSML